MSLEAKARALEGAQENKDFAPILSHPQKILKAEKLGKGVK